MGELEAIHERGKRVIREIDMLVHPKDVLVTMSFVREILRVVLYGKDSDVSKRA